jgi:hypothetical protein
MGSTGLKNPSVRSNPQSAISVSCTDAHGHVCIPTRPTRFAVPTVTRERNYAIAGEAVSDGIAPSVHQHGLISVSQKCIQRGREVPGTFEGFVHLVENPEHPGPCHIGWSDDTTGRATEHVHAQEDALRRPFNYHRKLSRPEPTKRSEPTILRLKPFATVSSLATFCLPPTNSALAPNHRDPPEPTAHPPPPIQVPPPPPSIRATWRAP